MSFASICERLHLSCLLDALCNVRYFSAGEVGCTENPSTLTGDGAAPEPPLLHSVRAQCVWERGGVSSLVETLHVGGMLKQM